MEPTYLIRVEHDPSDETLPWTAKVTRLSDLTHAVTRWGTTEDEAIKAAQRWMESASGVRAPGRELYATEEGELIRGESVRVIGRQS